MSKHICRLCGRENDEGNYCPACVPSAHLRNRCNSKPENAANMYMVDYRARTGAGIQKVSEIAHVHYNVWRAAESDRRSRINRSVAQKVARLLGMAPEVLFADSVTFRPPEVKPRHKKLKPGESQRLLEQDCAKAKQAGYGAHYGKWRADVEGRG